MLVLAATLALALAAAPELAPALALAGWVGASSTRREEARCRDVVQTVALRDSVVPVQVEQVTRAERPGRATALVRGHAWHRTSAGSRCELPVTLRLAASAFAAALSVALGIALRQSRRRVQAP